MAGKTGYTPVTNGDSADFAADITGVYEHFDPLVGETAPDVASLPAGLGAGGKGRQIWVEDVQRLYVWSGSAWVIVSTVDTGWTPITTFGTGWSATAGHQPRVRRVGDRVDLTGAVTRGSGASGGDLMTIPVGFRMTGAYTLNFLSASVSSGNKRVQPMLDAGHKIQLAYGEVTATGEAIPLNGFWYVN